MDDFNAVMTMMKIGIRNGDIKKMIVERPKVVVVSVRQQT